MIRRPNQEPNETHTSSPSWMGKLILVLCGVFFALLLAELYLRSPFVPTRYRWELLEAWAPGRWWLDDVDPLLWHRLPANLDVVIQEPGGISFRVHTTSLGFSGIGFREEAAVRPAWAVAVGDSFTMGWGVNADQVWVKQLERRIERPILNLGISGTCPTVYTHVLERYGFSFQPRLVLYQVYVGNDLEDEWSFLQWRQHPWLAKLHLFAKRHSYLYVFLQPRIRSGLFGMGEVPGTPQVSPHETERVVERGWTLASTAIRQAQKLAEEHGARLVILLVPAPEAVRGTPADAAAREERKRALFVNFCQAERLECIDLEPALREAARQGRAVFLADRHFTVEGNRVVADAVRTWLPSKGLAEEAR